MKQILLFLFITVSTTRMISAQKAQDMLGRKNVIKMEFVSTFLYQKAYIFSYERVTTPHQSFSVTAGYQEFPKFTSIGSNITATKSISKSGIKLGGEYRFYLQKENKFAAPRGVYIGPYLSYHDFNNSRMIEVNTDGTTEEVNLTSSFSILNIGAQLGYQFVIGNRWTVDLIFIGPSISNYKAKLAFEGDYTFNIEDVQNEIALKLIEEFPMLEEVLTNKEVTSSGRMDTWSLGYRHQFLVGYHFGRKKK